MFIRPCMPSSAHNLIENSASTAEPQIKSYLFRLCDALRFSHNFWRYVVIQTAMTPPQNPRMTPKKIRKTTTFSRGLPFSDMDSIAAILSKIAVALGLCFPNGDTICVVFLAGEAWTPSYGASAGGSLAAGSPLTRGADNRPRSGTAQFRIS